MLLLFSIILNIISLNIRVGGAPDGDNSWEKRKNATIALVGEEQPDLFTLQEAMDFQVEFIDSLLVGYNVIGKGKDRAGVKCEHMTMFYKADRFECLEWGTFWLSDTPDAASIGWDGAYMRSATWALMREKGSGEQFYIVNTHLDHIGKTARIKGAQTIVNRMRKINTANLPLVVTGDFNTTIESGELKIFSDNFKNSRESAKITDNILSFNAWGEGISNLDFIWYSGFSECLEFKTITRKFLGIPYISDHWPIRAVLQTTF